MESKDQGTVESLLSQLGKKIDNGIKKGKKKIEGFNFESRIEELKKDSNTLKKEYDDFVSENHQVFEDLKSSSKESFQEMKDLFKRKKSKTF